MKHTLIFAVSVTAATLLCGPASPTVAAASCGGALLICWFAALRRDSGAVPIYAVNDPAVHNPEITAAAVERALVSVLAARAPHDLHIVNPGINRLSLRLDAAGALTASDAHRTLKIRRGERWIADHPLPLVIAPGESRSLRLTPAEGERVRVREIQTSRRSRTALLLLAPAAALLLTDHNAAAAALFAALFIATKP
jgi:hypothetical protein